MRPPTGFLCLDKDVPTEIFFPDNLKLATILRAKRFCSLCLRRQDCLEIALKTGEEHGIFGGMTYDERRSYLVSEALKAGKDYSSQQNTLHEQQHLQYVNLSSQQCNVNVQIHIPLVLSWVVEVPRLSPIVLTKFV